MNKCVGCGITLQNYSSNELGYTKNLDNLYCERCFKTIHYNEEKKIENFKNEDIIAKINKLNLMTIFITDLLSINTTLIAEYKKIKNKKVLVINKCDLIPQNLKLEHISENISKSFNVKENIFFISGKENLYLDQLMSIIEEHKKVIFAGETSSGKSTLINNLLGSNLTTSKFNNTTLDFIKLKYQNYQIYDSPGILLDCQKENVTKINVFTKKLKQNFVYTIGNLKIKGNGNITGFLPNNLVIRSKKENIALNNKLELINSDIELENGGFIFIKDKVIIESNKKLNIRHSIIRK